MSDLLRCVAAVGPFPQNAIPSMLLKVLGPRFYETIVRQFPDTPLLTGCSANRREISGNNGKPLDLEVT